VEKQEEKKEKIVEIEDENLTPVDFEKIHEQELARKTRIFFDTYRSIQLFAYLEATLNALKAWKESGREVAKLAADLAKEHIKDYLAGRKPPRTWSFSLTKWTVILILGLASIVAFIIVFGGII